MRDIEDNLYVEFLEERYENASVKSTYGLSEDLSFVDEFVLNRKNKRKRYTITRKGVALLVAICVIASGAFGSGAAVIINNVMNSHSSQQRMLDQSLGFSATGTTLEQATGSKLTIQQIISLTANAVVEIRTEKVATDSWMSQYVTQGAGSGVIIASDGYIMTNQHVIQGANKINVTLKNGTKYEAKIVGSDTQTDIAVIKINANNLTSVVFGDSDSIHIGDLTVAIGNPLGQLGGTATAGIISSLDRQLTIDGKTMKLLQTDASINPGNSGGGLFDQYGQLVGLVVAKSSGSNVEGLGFAIPVNTAKEIALQIIDHGYVKGRIDTGMTFVDLTSMQNAIFYGVRNFGIYVKSVDASNARDAGFESGDRIYYIEDTRIESASDLTNALQNYKVGDKVRFTVIRGYETKELTLTLGEKKGN